MSTTSPPPSPPQTAGVRTEAHRRLGVFAVAFMIVAASAPLTVIAGGSTSAFSVTHVLGIPFGFLLLAAVLAIFAVGYAAMSRFVTNAGAFYSYVAQGIGRPMGVGGSILALISYNAMQIGIWGMFGFQVSSFIESKTGWSSPWWMWVLIGIVVVGIMGVNRVDLSAKVLGVLVGLEFLVVIVFDVVAFANPTEGFTAEPVTPSALFVPGVGAALAFGIAAFMGFESAAIYGEESKDPKRTIPRATFLAVAVIGVFYTISSWALALGIGPDKIVDPNGITAEEAGPPLFFNFVYGAMGEIWVDIMSLLFITSVFAAVVSFHNAVARYAFSLGREGVLPVRLAAIRENSGAPWAGSLFQSIIAIVVIVGFMIGELGWDPANGPFAVLTLFTWLTNLGAFGLVLLMVLVSLAVIGFFLRDPKDVGIGSRMVAPVISFVCLGMVWVLILLNWDVLLGQAQSTPTTFILPAVILVPSIAAVFWALRLRTTKPEIYKQIGHGADPAAAPHLGSEPVGI